MCGAKTLKTRGQRKTSTSSEMWGVGNSTRRLSALLSDFNPEIPINRFLGGYLMPQQTQRPLLLLRPYHAIVADCRTLSLYGINEWIEMGYGKCIDLWLSWEQKCGTHAHTHTLTHTTTIIHMQGRHTLCTMQIKVHYKPQTRRLKVAIVMARTPRETYRLQGTVTIQYFACLPPLPSLAFSLFASFYGQCPPRARHLASCVVCAAHGTGYATSVQPAQSAQSQ